MKKTVEVHAPREEVGTGQPHERDEQVEDHDVGQEDDDRPHAADDHKVCTPHRNRKCDSCARRIPDKYDRKIYIPSISDSRWRKTPTHGGSSFHVRKQALSKGRKQVEQREIVTIKTKITL